MVELVHQSTVTLGDLMQQGTIYQLTSVLVMFAHTQVKTAFHSEQVVWV